MIFNWANSCLLRRPAVTSMFGHLMTFSPMITLFYRPDCRRYMCLSFCIKQSCWWARHSNKLNDHLNSLWSSVMLVGAADPGNNSLKVHPCKWLVSHWHTVFTFTFIIFLKITVIYSYNEGALACILGHPRGSRLVPMEDTGPRPEQPQGLI